MKATMPTLEEQSALWEGRHSYNNRLVPVSLSEPDLGDQVVLPFHLAPYPPALAAVLHPDGANDSGGLPP